MALTEDMRSCTEGEYPFESGEELDRKKCGESLYRKKAGRRMPPGREITTKKDQNSKRSPS
jgi:hypothetical protein